MQVIIFGISWFPINLINLLADCLELGNCICLPKIELYFYLYLYLYQPPRRLPWARSTFYPFTFPYMENEDATTSDLTFYNMRMTLLSFLNDTLVLCLSEECFCHPIFHQTEMIHCYHNPLRFFLLSVISRDSLFCPIQWYFSLITL